jgi:hypothetical protein
LNLQHNEAVKRKNLIHNEAINKIIFDCCSVYWALCEVVARKKSLFLMPTDGTNAKNYIAIIRIMMGNIPPRINNKPSLGWLVKFIFMLCIFYANFVYLCPIEPTPFGTERRIIRLLQENDFSAKFW